MTGFPMLIAAIRASGLKQWRIAQLAAIPESRLSRIGRHGGASRDERQKLSRLLGVPEAELFGPGPTVSLQANLSQQNPGAVATDALERATRGAKWIGWTEMTSGAPVRWWR